MTDTTKHPSKAEKRRARQEEAQIKHDTTQSPVKPRTPGQRRYMASLKANTTTIALGPAGTGKTFLAASLAAQMVKAGQIKHIVLVRPAVEAGEEKHGFLPGDINKKLAPWAEPVMAVLRKRLGEQRVIQMIFNKDIRVEPFTYMRGLTFDDSFVILDEAQNTSVAQMKLFTTRIGTNCKVVIDGDVEQTDMLDRDGKPIPNGLNAVIDIAHRTRMEDTAVVRLTRRDIVRSEVTKRWVEGWDMFEGKPGDDTEIDESYTGFEDFGKFPSALPFFGHSAVGEEMAA